MEEKTLHNGPRALCVNIEKVYDWIVEQATGSTTVPLGAFTPAIPAGATNVTVSCFLSDSNGVPVPTNSQLSVVETAPRQDREFEVRGRQVTLQTVSYTKTVYAVVEVSGVDPATGNHFIISSTPRPFTFLETAYLCAPAGTSLVVRVSDFDCLTVIQRNADGDIIGFALSIFLCQSIQTVAPLTVELCAETCRPRRPLTETCGRPDAPPGCPGIFPERD